MCLSLCLLHRGAQASPSLGRYATWFSWRHFCSKKPPSYTSGILWRPSLIWCRHHPLLWHSSALHFSDRRKPAQILTGSPSEWLLLILTILADGHCLCLDSIDLLSIRQEHLTSVVVYSILHPPAVILSASLKFLSMKQLKRSRESM